MHGSAWVWTGTPPASGSRLAPRRPAAELQNVVFPKDFQGFGLTVALPGCTLSGTLAGPGQHVGDYVQSFVSPRFSNGFPGIVNQETGIASRAKTRRLIR